MSDIETDIEDLAQIIAGQALRIEALEAALRSIANKCPATCDMTLAHEMAQEAEEALAAQEKPAQEKPKEPPPPADEMGTSLKDGWSKDRR